MKSRGLVGLGLVGVAVGVGAGLLGDEVLTWPRRAQVVAVAVLMVTVVALGALKDSLLVGLATADTRSRDLDRLVEKVLTRRGRVRVKVFSLAWSLVWLPTFGLGVLLTPGQSDGTSHVLLASVRPALVGLVVIGMVATAAAGWVDPLSERALRRVWRLFGAVAVAGGGLFLALTTREQRFAGGTPDTSMAVTAALLLLCSAPIVGAYRSAEVVRKARAGDLGAEAVLWVAAAAGQGRTRGTSGDSTVR